MRAWQGRRRRSVFLRFWIEERIERREERTVGKSRRGKKVERR